MLMRLLAGTAAGLIGTLSALAIFLLARVAQPQGEKIATSYSLVAILAMVFFSTITSNLLAGTLLHFGDPQKYPRLKALLFQIFVFTIFLFICSIPFYLFTSDTLLGTAGIHFLASALICALICEIVSGWKNALTGLLGIIVAGSFLYGIFSLLFWVLQNDSLLLIFFLPIAWMIITLAISLVEMAHQGFATLYGSAPLSPEETVSSTTRTIRS